MAKYFVSFSDTFKQSLKKLTAIDQKRVVDKISFLEDNPWHPSLRTKKLRGKTDLHESSVSMSIRLFWRKRDNAIFMTDIGHHDILRKY